MIKLCHEVPKALFAEARKFNDYDYYLDYLWEDKEYKKYFEESLKIGRTVILDSSLFEFHPYVPPMSRIYEHTRYFSNFGKNIEYIVTDVLNNCEATIKNFVEWEEKYKSTCPGVMIGVCQGDTVKSLRECYLFMSKHADKIAIPFDSAAFDELVTEEESEGDQLVRWALGRQRFIRDLVIDGLWNSQKNHHLLGCSYAWEFKYNLYKNVSIESIDTSSPVVCGLSGVKYEELDGNPSKPSVKLCDLIDAIPTDNQLDLIKFNTSMFRKMVND